MAKSTDAVSHKGDAAAEAARKAEEAARLAKIQAEIEAERKRQAEEARRKQQEAEEAKKLEQQKNAHKNEPEKLNFSADNIYQSKQTNVKEKTDHTTEVQPKQEKPVGDTTQAATKEKPVTDNSQPAIKEKPASDNANNTQPKPEATNTPKPERPSDEQIQATARQLREDLRVDKWAIDLRGGDANKAEQTLSALPRDKETMERLQKSYAEDKDHPNSNLSRDIENRLSKDDANRLKATIENPESNLARLENVTRKLSEDQSQKDGQNNLKPFTDAVSVVAPVTGLVADYNENETDKHLNADRRELRQQLSVMNSKDIEAANQESLTKNGKPLEQMLLETPGLREEDKTAIQILLKGSDERAKNPELNAQLAAEAVKAKDVDMLSQALGSSPEAREIFQKRGNLELLPQAFSGNELKRAQDLASHGETQAGTLVEFHQGLFGTDKAGVEQAVKTLSDEQRAALRRGHELANCPTCPADATAADISAMQTYQKFNQTLDYSFNDRDAGDLKAKALYGENNLISNLAATHSDGFIGIGAGHDKTKIYDIVDRQLSQEDYDRLKNDKNFRSDLNENLKTYLSQEELDRVNGIIDKKMQTGSYEESKTVGRSTSERLSDLKDGGVSSQDKATAIADILTMSPAERLKYKDDQNYRQEVDRNLQETLGKDDDSTKIAQRLLSDTAAGKEPQLTALEKIQVGGLSDAGLPKTIENIENFIQSDPKALERIKNPTTEEDKQLKQTLERELRMAVNRSGEVYYDENGGSNFDSIYKPLADSLFEKNGRVDIGEKLSHTDRDLDAYQALTKLSPQEKAALLNANPQTEEEKSIQRSVFNRFDSPAEKQLAQEIITSGQFNELNQLRAATITDQSLQPGERDTVKEILGKVKPEDRTAFNDAYAKQYNDNLTDVLNKIPREEQASFQSLLQGTGRTRAEQVEELAQNRRESESGLLGNFDSGVQEVAIQNNQTFLKANETASAKFEDLPLEKQQALFNNASETYAKWQQDKAERANQVTDGVIIGGSLLLTAGASAPVVLSAAAVGGTVKVVGNKALIGDNYGSVEEVTTDFSKGSLNTLLNTLGPAQAASALKLGNNLSREATETIVTKLAQESVELGSNKLLQEGSEQVIQKELNRLIQTSIVDGSDTVSQKAIKQLVSKVATEGNEEVVEKVITTSLSESTEALAKRSIIQKVATEQGLNASAAYTGGVGSGTIEGLSKWDPALSTEENIKRTLQTANDTGLSSAVTAVGFTGILQTGRGILGKLGNDLQVPTAKAGSDEGNIKAPSENGESRLLRQNPETAILSEARPVVKIDADVEIGLRKYNVNGENFRLQHAQGFFYNRFPSSASEVTDIKVHVTSSSPQDLARLQEVLIPALQKDPELAKLVPYWKTQDPLYGIGHPEAHGSYPNGQDQGAKAFTLYSKSPADAIAAQKRIDQILSDAKLGLDKPIDSGNVDTIHGASNRVGIVRDHWEITQTSSGLMAAKVDKPLVERIEAQFGNGKLNDSQLRQVEKESGIRANSLEYDRSGNLALKTYASEPHGKGIYLTEAGSDKTVGRLTDRPAMYALARRYDTDPAALAAGKLNLGETPVKPVVAPEIASPVRQEQNAFNAGESKPNNYLVLPDGKKLEAGKSELILGRDPSTDVVFGANDVSRNHAKLKVTADGVKIEDLNSKNGTFVNGERITGEALLKPGDKIRLGQNSEFEFKQTVPANLEYKGKPLSLTKQELTLGRAPNSDLTFSDGTVSREHAKIQKNGDTYSITDLDSRNGTFVNGKRINGETPLKEGDRIRLGNDADELVFRGETEPKLEPVRPRPVMEYQVTGNGSDSVMGAKAQRQSRDLVERFEISEKLEDGFQDIGHNARLRADGQFDDPLRPAIVVDRTQDPVLAKFVEDAKQKFAPLQGDPEALSQALSKHVRENLTPAGWTQEQLTENYLRFSTENANKRILLGEFLEQAKAGKGGGVCNEQSLLLKVLADEFGLDAKVIRGHYGKLPETGLNPNARPNHAWVEITAPGGQAKIYDPRAKIDGVPSENAFNHHPGNGLLRPVETVLAKDAQFGLSEGSPIIHNGQSWKYQGRDKNGDIIITADARKEITAAELQRLNPGKNIELGQMYRVPRSNGQIEDDWIVSGINRDNNLVLFKENGLRTTIKADELARENPAIKPVAILSGRDSGLPESYFISDRAVRLNSGGEGVVYDNLDGTVTKSGSNVDPNEVTMLQALRRAGGNVPDVVSHGYDVNGNYNVRMEKLNGPTLLEWIGSASKGDLEKMREKMSRFFDQVSPLYPGDAGGGENWIIVGNEPYAIDVSQGGKNRSMNNTEKREMLELLDWEIARRSMH